jgi:hypothetical protein
MVVESDYMYLDLETNRYLIIMALGFIFTVAIVIKNLLIILLLHYLPAYTLHITYYNYFITVVNGICLLFCFVAFYSFS